MDKDYQVGFLRFSNQARSIAGGINAEELSKKIVHDIHIGQNAVDMNNMNNDIQIGLDAPQANSVYGCVLSIPLLIAYIITSYGVIEFL